MNVFRLVHPGNWDEKVVKKITWCDCEGNMQCLEYCELAPFKGSDFMSDPSQLLDGTMNTCKPCIACIVKVICEKKKYVRVELTKSLEVGALLSLDRSKQTFYYLKRKLRKITGKGNYILDIARIDGKDLVSLDLELIRKTKKVYIKGYLVEKCEYGL